MADPIYMAGFVAGIEAAAAHLDGRASMGRELGREYDALALEAAAAALRKSVERSSSEEQR